MIFTITIGNRKNMPFYCMLSQNATSATIFIAIIRVDWTNFYRKVHINFNVILQMLY